MLLFSVSQIHHHQRPSCPSPYLLTESVGSTATSGLERLIRTLMTVEEVLQEKRIRLGQPFSLV